MYFDRKDDIFCVKWAKEVKIRDYFTCQVCGRRGVELNAHHIRSWDVHVEERYDMDNGITLCADNCHAGFHKIYGHGHNDEIQFNEFKKIMFIFNKTIELKNISNEVSRLLMNENIIALVNEKLFKDGYEIIMT